MRPSVSGPTGTVIGPPVSTTSWPRTRPSVLSIAIQRTVRSPSSWATSSTSVCSDSLVCSAFWMNRRSPSNCTSTTAPCTWVTRPTMLLAISLLPLSDGFSAGNDFDEFLGDIGLARAVIVQRQAFDHVAGVARRVVHRGHARAVFAGGTFQQRPEDRDGKGLRKKAGEDGFLVRLEFVRGAAQINPFAFRRGRRGDELLLGDDLRDHRTEAVVDQDADVDLACGQHGGDTDADVLGIAEFQAALAGEGDVAGDAAGQLAAQIVAALAADRQDLDGLAFGLEAASQRAGRAADTRIERAGEASVGSDRHEQVVLLLASAGGEGGGGRHVGDRGGEGRRHALYALGIGACGFSLHLGAPQLRRRDHLHGGGYLLGRLHAVDACAKVFQAGHGSPAIGLIASTAKQSRRACAFGTRLLRRCAPRNDGCITRSSWRSFP